MKIKLQNSESYVSGGQELRDEDGTNREGKTYIYNEWVAIIAG